MTFLSAAVASCDGPARQALFPTLVPQAVLPNAVALNSVLMKGPALIGPLLAGAVISLIGTHGGILRECGELSLHGGRVGINAHTHPGDGAGKKAQLR